MSQQALALARKGLPWRRGTAWWIVGIEGTALAIVGIYVVIEPDRSRDIIRQITVSSPTCERLRGRGTCP